VDTVEIVWSIDKPQQSLCLFQVFVSQQTEGDREGTLFGRGVHRREVAETRPEAVAVGGREFDVVVHSHRWRGR